MCSDGFSSFQVVFLSLLLFSVCFMELHGSLFMFLVLGVFGFVS